MLKVLTEHGLNSGRRECRRLALYDARGPRSSFELSNRWSFDNSICEVSFEERLYIFELHKLVLEVEILGFNVCSRFCNHMKLSFAASRRLLFAMELEGGKLNKE